MNNTIATTHIGLYKGAVVTRDGQVVTGTPNQWQTVFGGQFELVTAPADISPAISVVDLCNQEETK